MGYLKDARYITCSWESCQTNNIFLFLAIPVFHIAVFFYAVDALSCRDACFVLLVSTATGEPIRARDAKSFGDGIAAEVQVVGYNQAAGFEDDSFHARGLAGEWPAVLRALHCMQPAIKHMASSDSRQRCNRSARLMPSLSSSSHVLAS